MTDYSQFLRFMLGILIITAVAGMRFNRPSWCRSYTTAARHGLMLAVYVLSQVFVYYLLSSLALRLTDGVLGIDKRDASQLVLSSPILVALVITLLLPFISWYDRWPRQVLQRSAGIPEVGERLARMLSDAEFAVPEQIEANAKAILLRRGIDCDQDWLPPAKAALQLFLKATVLFQEMRSWEKQARYAPFMDEVRKEFDAFRQRFDQLSLKVSRTFIYIERLGEIKRQTSGLAHAPPPTPLGSDSLTMAPNDVTIDDVLKKIIGDMVTDLHEGILIFFQQACLLVARAVLACERTEVLRTRRLRKLGFRLERQTAARSYNPILYAAGALLAGIWLFFAVIARTTDLPTTTLWLPTLVLLITAIQVGALMVAVVPKTLWGFANAGNTNRTPILFVIGAGLAAMLLALCINVVVGFVAVKGWDGVMTRLRDSSPYLPSSFATAAATAYLIQDHRWASTASLLAQRSKDAVFMGAAWLIANLVTLVIRIVEGVAFDIDGFLRQCIVSFAFGCVVGFLVPASFREPRLSLSAAGVTRFQATAMRRGPWEQPSAPKKTPSLTHAK